MKFAYLILAHKNLNQLKILLKLLDDEKNTIFIHIDKKSDVLYNELKYILIKSHLNIVENQVDVKWGDYTQLDATLELFKSVKEDQSNFDYIHLISGQDLPLTSNHNINNFFKENKGKEFVHLENIGQNPKDLDYRWSCYHLINRRSGNPWITRLSNQSVKLQRVLGIKRKFPEGFTIVKGSQWFSITNECFNYVYDFMKSNDKFCNFFKVSYCPDESVIQTIIYNSKFKDKVINDNMRFIDWKIGPVLPTTFREEHFELLMNSGKFWGRKFDVDYDQLIIKKIYKKIIVGD